MLGTWLSHGGAKADAATTTSHFQPPVVFGHFLPAVAGLVAWVVYVVNDSEPLAWIAFIDLLVVAAIGEPAGVSMVQGSAKRPGRRSRHLRRSTHRRRVDRDHRQPGAG
jgi:hypothetical protein